MMAGEWTECQRAGFHQDCRSGVVEDGGGGRLGGGGAMEVSGGVASFIGTRSKI